MKLSHVALCLAALMLPAGPSFAGRCLDYAQTSIVWCDDFDNYCYANNPDNPWPGYPPVPDTRCATDTLQEDADEGFFRETQHWPMNSRCTSFSMGPVTTVGAVYNAPFSIEYQGGAKATQRHEHDMTLGISSRYPGMSAVNGTDADPLVLRYWGWSASGAGGYPNSPMYVELMLDDDWAPTDYVWKNCEGTRIYPIVCQQWLWYETTAPCPTLSTQVHASHTFGWLAQLDRNPCDIETGRKPTMYHAATFDGLQWYDLRHTVFPGYGDFNHDDGGAWFQMTIKSSTYTVRLESGTGGTSEATLPRQYTGPFNKVALGTAPGCELDATTGACKVPDSYACWNYAVEDSDMGWTKTLIDTPVLYDGVYVSLSGACCATDGTCTVIDQSACEAVNGRFGGISTTCEEVLCCPLPFADADIDGDVDQDDFGAWQLCHTGSGGGVPTGCDCYDRDGNGDIDYDDFTAFAACETGPNVPWSQNLTPSCDP